MWDASKHIVEPFFIPSGWEMWRAMDWGYSAPYCVLYFAMNPDGVIFVFREIYGKGERDGEGSRENVDQVAQKMKAREASDERNGYEYRYSIADSAIFLTSVLIDQLVKHSLTRALNGALAQKAQAHELTERKKSSGS